MKKPVIYEFIGIPGAGKTTITNNLKKNINFFSREDLANEVKKMHLTSKICIFGIFIYRNYKFVLMLLFFLLKNWDGKRRAISIFINITKYVAVFEKAIENIENKGIRLVILDEGMTHAIWVLMLHLTKNDTGLLNKIMEYLSGRYDIHYVYITLDMQTSISRITRRVKTRCEFDIMCEEDIEKVFKPNLGNYDLILKSISPERVLVIDGRQDSDLNTEIILNKVNT